VIVRKLRVRNSRQISISKPTKERTIQHLLNVFVLKNVLNFAMPAKPESGCQKTLLNGLLGVARRRQSRWNRQGHQRNNRDQRPRELSPTPSVYVVWDCQHTESAAFVNGVFDTWAKFSRREIA